MPADIVVKDLPTIYALVIRRRIARAEIAATLGETLPRVFEYAQRNGLALAGPPFARYPESGEDSLVIEAGVTIVAPPAEQPPEQPAEDIEVLTIPAGPAAVTVHHGPYDRLQQTYQAIEAWLRDEGRAPNGPPWESYLTDPGERPDPETWETEVVHPIK